MKVDVDKINSVMKEIENCKNEYENIIKRENKAVNELSKYWQGDDYNKFKAKWNDITKKNKSPEKLYREQLDEYYNYLKKAKSLYESNQKTVKDISKKLPS